MGTVPGAAYAKAPITDAAAGSGAIAAQTEAAKPPAEAKPDLAALRRMFDDFQSLTADARKESGIDDDYFHSKQWTRNERRVLQARKQPDLVFNRIKPEINSTLGVIKQGASDPRAFPRNPDDEDSADVASKTLRFIADVNRFDATKIDVARNYMVEGTGAAIVEVEGEDLQIKVTQIRWEEFFYDPRSRRPDFADARYRGIAKWMYADEVTAAHPDAKSDIDGALQGGGLPVAVDSGLQDRPHRASGAWIDRRQRRLLIVEVYYKEAGKWLWAVFHAGGLLDSGPSPYLDDKGKPDCPIEAQSCYVDKDNNRYGLVRDMRDVQDEINKRRSKMLHELNTRLVQESSFGSLAGQDLELVRKEAAKPDGVIPSGAQIVPKGDVLNGQFELLQEAKAEIERMGPNPAILGRQAASASGRSQLVRQQAGLTELATVFGGIEDWELRIYRQAWSRAKQFWTAPMWVRVTDDTQAPQFVGLNQPKGAPVVDPATGQAALGPDGQPVEGDPQFHPATDDMGQPHPQAGESIFGYKNQVADMDIDIIVDTTPDTANLQQEQFSDLVDLGRSGMVRFPPSTYLKASSLQNKRELLEDLKQADGAQQPDPAKLLELTEKQADIGKTTADGQLSHAKALLTMVQADQLAGTAVDVMPVAEPGWAPAGQTTPLTDLPGGPPPGPGPQGPPNAMSPPQPPPGAMGPPSGPPGPV